MIKSTLSFPSRVLERLFTPLARVMANPKRGRTWQYEAVAVASILIIVSVLTSPNLSLVATNSHTAIQFFVIWISAAAVFGSFLHAQIGAYMAEDMSYTEEPLTPCFHKLDTYWIWKEILWFLVFFISGAYPAIAGNIIFILYPTWRRTYKKIRKELSVPASASV